MEALTHRLNDIQKAMDPASDMFPVISQRTSKVTEHLGLPYISN
jgi:hypothetical protein